MPRNDLAASGHRGTRRVVAVYIWLVVVPVALAVAVLSHGGAGTRKCMTSCSGPTAASGNAVATLLLTVAVVVAACKAFGMLARRMGQPAVLGEIATGILLGPSVLGALRPDGGGWLLPAPALPQLDVLAQLGVVLFVFLAGMDLDTRMLHGRGQLTMVVSHVSIALPALLGVVVAFAARGRLSPPGVSFAPFALFIGISMSITALPVMAAILQDVGLYRSQVGTVALTCALVDDVTAWCLLAFLVALVKGASPAGVLVTVALTALFSACLLLIMRPLLARARSKPGVRGPQWITSLGLVGVLLAALSTEWIGVHAIFGAFLFGLAIPREPSTARQIRETIGGLTTALLMPLFFAYNGLRTEIGLLGGDLALWLWCGLILLMAVAGKLGGAAVAARAVGASWAQSVQIGALMNCRGLTELIVLNIGLDLQLLSPTLFTMLVVMALVSTAMAAPILTRFEHACTAQEGG